ncbi:EF-hand calcium-binding domain-containing protein 12 isoform X2 [Rhineura floridana]|uniref:EF-hand calcium-binding domain-containing protein 12 isoform X2 n=1 Tax=Rhineura floridana TaxID=261503 RepID=UPI002AC8875C|nr:EF-hand calcium-binding domain-containing protein 12 isoform X2 [Rhineura floridana]
MSTKVEQMSWTTGISGSEIGSWEVSSTSQPRSSFVPSTRRESDVISNEGLLKESPSESLNWVLEHCFQQYKLRDAYPHFFFKVKKSRFGPPKSRRRIIIAPPMSGMAASGPKPHPPAPSVPEQKPPGQRTLEAEEKISPEEEELRELEAWIKERKQLQDLLNNCVNIEKWLTGKQPLNEQEQHVLGKIQESKEVKKAKMETLLEEMGSKEDLTLKKASKNVIPLIEGPYPESLMTLQNLLHKQKLKLVDLFKKSDRTKTMRFRRADFIRIIQETKVPISKSDLEDVIIYLTSSKKGNYITSEDLVECQRIWVDNIREQWKQSKDSKPEEFAPAAPKTASVHRKSLAPIRSKARLSSACAPCEPKLIQLEVPPINTEPDRMHLTYNQMEEVGKRYKEMRRQLKRKTSPLEYAEQCRLVRSGDLVVDGHCCPSTIQGEMGELVDQHRLACHLVYTQCLKLCEKYGVPLTEKLLKKALLYPGDRIVREGNSFQKMRQPGGYYDLSSTVQRGSPSREQPSSSSGDQKSQRQRLRRSRSKKQRPTTAAGSHLQNLRD